MNLSSTIIKPSSEVPANIFDNSALYPAPINSTVCGVGPVSPTYNNPQFIKNLTTPTKKGPIEVHHLKSADEIPQVERTPVKQKTPVKSFAQVDQELELVSPAKRVGDNIVRNLESEDEEDQTDGVLVSENVVDEVVTEAAEEIKLPAQSLKFRKTDSEHSLAASSDRTTPEPNPSSGYSSEPQADPPSPGYMSDHSSPGKVQVSSPNKPSKKSRTEKELGRLQDRMSGFFSPVGTRRKRKNRLETLKDVDANDEIVNESVHATPPKNVIVLHSDSPLVDVKDELLITPRIVRSESVKSCKSEENVLQSKIRLPRELTNLNDLMSPFFSTGEVKRKSALRKQLVKKPAERKGKALKRRQSVAGEMMMVSSKKKPRRQSMRPVTYKEKEYSDDSQTDEEVLVRLVENHYEKSESDKEYDVPDDDLPEPNIDCRMDTPEKVEPADSHIIDLTSPPRFKCDYCEKLFKNRSKLLDHKQKELEEIQAKNTEKRKCVACGTTFKTVKDLAVHGREAGCKPKRLSDVTTLDLQSNQEFNLGKVKQSPEASPTPKLVAQLQDKLSGYFSPSTSETRVRKVPERLVEVYTHQVQATPKSSKVQKTKFFRTKTFLQEAPATSTPNEGRPRRPLALKPDVAAETPGNLSSRRRSVREKNISYAEFPDFESSNTESDITISPEERRKAPKSTGRKKFVLASKRSPVKKTVTPEKLVLSPTFSNHSMMTLSPSVTKHFRQMKKRGLIVKNLNDSQEIQDVSSALDESQEIDNSPIRTPTKSPCAFMSPGKYFSIAKVTETPTGQIRMKLNRITKPHQPTGTPVISRKPAAAKRTPENQQSYKDLIIPRLNRSACKEMGLSPNKP